MRRRGFATLLVLCAACSAAPAPSPPLPDGAVRFFDDFAGSSLDRTKWNVEVRSETVNDELQAYVDTPATLAIVHGAAAAGARNGALRISSRIRPGFINPRGTRLDFISGQVHTRGRFEFAYGTAAARIKLPAGTGLWPAFWVLGTGDWPATGEIDIMENVGEPDWASVALHGPGYSGDTPLFNRLYFPADSNATAWHVYSVQWTPDSLVFRVDEAIAYRATRPMIEHYGRWSFDDPKYLIINLALGGAYPLKVNGVRSPSLGMPEATVRRIEQDRASMLVDWVKVTR